MLPTFFIIGAPKCGTTSVARWLSQHPDVLFADIKEPHFFNTDMNNRQITSLSEYERLFDKRNGTERVVGEASTWYLYSQTAVTNIEKTVIDPLYIVLLRNPITMVQSLYSHNVLHCHEDASSFEEAWLLQETRARGRQIPARCKEPSFLQYGCACSLGSQLERLVETVPKQRVHCIVLDDLIHNPKSEYIRTLSFLGLKYDGRDEFMAYNRRRIARSMTIQKILLSVYRTKKALGIRRQWGLLKWNEREVPAAMRNVSSAPEWLAEYFDDEIRHVSRILGRNVWTC